NAKLVNTRAHPGQAVRSGPGPGPGLTSATAETAFGGPTGVDPTAEGGRAPDRPRDLLPMLIPLSINNRGWVWTYARVPRHPTGSGLAFCSHSYPARRAAALLTLAQDSPRNHTHRKDSGPERDPKSLKSLRSQPR